MKLLRHKQPDPQQLALQLDFFSGDYSSQPKIDQPAPELSPRRAQPSAPVPDHGKSILLSAGVRRLQIEENTLDFRLQRSKRRTIGFMIDDEGLRITAPKWITLAEIDSAIREKQRWIFTKLNERRERSARRLQPQMQWHDGALLPYLGKRLTLRIVATQSAGIVCDQEAGELTVCLPADAGEQQLKDRVQGWLQLEAKRLFGERLPLYAEKLDVTYRAYTLSSATTLWGSCTADGRIRLNWRLIHFSLPLIDYVIAHELSHLREMNHSPRFWATVQSVFPEFAAARKALRDQSQETLPIF